MTVSRDAPKILVGWHIYTSLLIFYCTYTPSEPQICVYINRKNVYPLIQIGAIL